MKCPFELPVEKYEPMTILRDAKMNYICDYGDDENVADYIVQAINSHEKLVKHIEALKSVCETYIPTDQMDEANSKAILLCMGNVEEIGRKLLAKQALEETEKL